MRCRACDAPRRIQTARVAFGVIGGCVAWARPRNPIGWLFILEGWCGGALAAIGEPYGVLALRGHDLPLAAWVAWIGGSSWSVAFLLGPTVVLTLWPSGRAPGRLRLLVIAAAIVTGAETVLAALYPRAMGPPVRALGQPLMWRPVHAIALAALPLISSCVIVCLVVAVRRLLRAAAPSGSSWAGTW